MRRNAIVVISLAAAMAFIQAPARSAESIALKSGETTEIGPEYWVANCRSILKGAMTVEILEGPPDVAASIREQDVLPRKQNCARPVPGRRAGAHREGNQGANPNKAHPAGEISNRGWRTPKEPQY